MGQESHPDYQAEAAHLQSTLQRIDREQRFLLLRNRELEQEVARTAGDPALYSQFNAARMNIAFNAEQVENVDRMREQVYFARLDFRERAADLERIYLGRLGFVSRETGDVVVVDWREPVATLYYGGTEGEMSYEAPGGLIECEVVLKRQLEVEGDILRNLFDVRLAQMAQGQDFNLPRDELLLSRLGQQADKRLRDIVSTIQREQNVIIRAGRERPLVVQGVAGSGKTTVALHRLAYLLYRYRDVLTPEKVLIIAPNRVFLSYISEVLPSLGVHDVTQATLQEYLQSVIARNLSILPISQKFALFLDRTDNAYLEATRELARLSSACKGDLRFLEVLDNMLEAAVRAALPRAAFCLFGSELATPAALWQRYLDEGNVAPPAKRLAAVKRHLQRLADQHLELVLKQCEAEYERKLSDLRQGRASGSKEMLKLYQQREDESERRKQEQQAALSAYLQLFGQLDPFAIYQALITDVGVLRQVAGKLFSRRTLEAVALLSAELLERGLVEPEDLAPLAYLRLRLHGVSEHARFQHVVIDEGQDLSPLEMLVLKQIVGHSSFTVVGDVSQSIQPRRGVRDWREITGGSFAGNDCRSFELTLSYRTTAEIVLFANHVLQSRHFGGQLAAPVMRSGALPYLGEVRDGAAQADLVASIIMAAREQRGLQTVAVVTRTAAEAKEAHRQLLLRGLTPGLMESDSDQYEGGILVMPAYLTKGLEFDVTIVYDASDEHYGDQELDAKLLYVTLTRALHELYVLYLGRVTPLLAGVDREFFQPLAP